MNNVLIEPEQLAAELGQPGRVIVDLCKPEVYAAGHIPGAVSLAFPSIVRVQAPVMGLLPDEAKLSAVLSGLGITPNTHVIAYDDEGGGKASRFLWTLAAVGHKHWSLLNGGLHAWTGDGHPVTTTPSVAAPSEYPAHYTGEVVADRAYILAHLKDNATVIVDARSPGEYNGTDVRAERGGHIPSAVNFDWQLGMDRNRGLRLRSAGDLLPKLTALGITPDKEAIAYCHTHHRSALTFVMLKALGFERVRGYPGSWSDWGNRADTPIE